MEERKFGVILWRWLELRKTFLKVQNLSVHVLIKTSLFIFIAFYTSRFLSSSFLGLSVSFIVPFTPLIVLWCSFIIRNKAAPPKRCRMTRSSFGSQPALVSGFRGRFKAVSWLIACMKSYFPSRIKTSNAILSARVICMSARFHCRGKASVFFTMHEQG